MPRTRKPAGTAVDPRNGRRADLVVGPAIHVDLSRPRESYDARALEVWDGFWTSPVAGTVTESDLMIVHTWIESYDSALRALQIANQQPVVKGSMGQPCANPLYQVASSSMALAMQCAKQLGIGGKNRADLGIALFAGQQAAAAAAASAVEMADDDEEYEDPRRAS